MFIPFAQRFVAQVETMNNGPYGEYKFVVAKRGEEQKLFLDNLQKGWRNQLLKEKEVKYHALVETVPDIIMQIDEEGNCVWTNRAGIEFFGGEIVGRCLKEYLVDRRDEKKISEALSFILSGSEQVFRMEILMRRSDGSSRILQWRCKALKYKDKAAGFISTARDITEQKSAEERIRYLSFHDQLTGLYNRAYFEEELKRLDTERQLPISIIIGDANGLKLVNDAFGHAAGDRLLKKIAEIMKRSCRKEDIVCRWGGDEYAVLLPQTGYDTASCICRRIKKACSEAPIDPVQPSIALGVATKEKSQQDINEIIRAAEERMYSNKVFEDRRNRTNVIYNIKKVLREKHYETEEHVLRIMKIVLQMGRTLGLSERHMDELALLAKFHDIGKIAIPDDVLNKSVEELSPGEWRIVKKHPEIGYRIARACQNIAHIAEAILYHHERWDGRGFPRGIKGKEIPLISRIIAIADTYDLMLRGRWYKEPVSKERAVKEIKECSGTRFDPWLVEVFMKSCS